MVGIQSGSGLMGNCKTYILLTYLLAAIYYISIRVRELKRTGVQIRNSKSCFNLEL